MKRDMDLIRKILIAVEEDTKGGIINLQIPGEDRTVVSYHVGLLVEAELLQGVSSPGTRDEHWSPTKLTWDGHEFLDVARNDTRWNEAKEQVQTQASALPFAILQALLTEMLRRAVLGAG